MGEDVLLEVASRTDYKESLKVWADLLVKLGLSSTFGVYARQVPAAGMGIFVGRHDQSSLTTRTKEKLMKAIDPSTGDPVNY